MSAPRYQGRHRAAPNKQCAKKVARLAVGGLVLAAAAEGFTTVPAWAADAPALARQLDCHHPAPRPVKVRTVAQVRHVSRPAVTPVRVPAPQPAPAATPDPLVDHYQVQSGDTLTHIAARYQIPWEALWAANSDHIPHPDRIYPGQLLRLPA